MTGYGKERSHGGSYVPNGVLKWGTTVQYLDSGTMWHEKKEYEVKLHTLIFNRSYFQPYRVINVGMTSLFRHSPSILGEK